MPAMRSIVLSLATCPLLSLALADCADVEWRQVLPGDAGITSVNATNRDVPHIVTAHPTLHANDILRIFLPGTFGQPGGSMFLLESLAECNRPTIGLSYNYIPAPNSVQNEICYNASGSNEDAIAGCLARQHSDGLFGSQSDEWDGLWPAVAEADSVSGRLKRLLLYLHDNFSDQGWDRFLNGNDPRWDRIMVTGHSQGAGHTAYLAQTVPLAAAALLSGPQDECINCAHGNANLWLSQPWATTHVTAAAHVSESAIDVIQDNWAKMVDFLGWPAQPTNVGITALTHPPYGDVLTEVPYEPQYTGPRPYHVSMAGDGCTPMTTHNGEEVAVYSLALWPALFADPLAAGSVSV